MQQQKSMKNPFNIPFTFKKPSKNKQSNKQSEYKNKKDTEGPA